MIDTSVHNVAAAKLYTTAINNTNNPSIVAGSMIMIGRGTLIVLVVLGGFRNWVFGGLGGWGFDGGKKKNVNYIQGWCGWVG